jgi:isocitrate dehydrogenase kinase/phosphatase
VVPETAIAKTILDGFDKHYRLFREISTNAKGRWERGDFKAGRDAMRVRMSMYDARVAECVQALLDRHADASDESLWPAIKLAYFDLLYEHKQPECAETFFNSVARRVLDRRYYKNDYIFRRPAISTEHLDGKEPTYRSYYPTGASDLRPALREILASFGIANAFQDLERDLDHLMRAVREEFPPDWQPQPNFQLQVLRSLFFRNKAAYVVGRVWNGNVTIPFVVPLLLDDEKRVFVDAALFSARDVGRLMSLGRAYFMVDMEVPSAYVDFLATLVPNRPKAELYTLVGLQKQGKTLFFRDLERHVLHSSDKFVVAPGTRGMVMLVFTLPSFPYVFKVIRDWFEPPKDSDKAGVRERYDFVKNHDRVGRMADTLEYAHVAFPIDRFDEMLMRELERIAPSAIEKSAKTLVIEHLYVERRLVPLDVYLSGADDTRLREGIREYGQAVKDMAHADLFPGDLLLKNFGVTRYGRAVFYDYDELTTLTECHFRALPKPQSDEDEMAAEPWFAVGPRDVFPEQFPQFLFPPGKPRDIFNELHGDLADPAFWRAQQERLRDGVADDVFPYPEERRFSKRYG